MEEKKELSPNELAQFLVYKKLVNDIYDNYRSSIKNFGYQFDGDEFKQLVFKCMKPQFEMMSNQCQRMAQSVLSAILRREGCKKPEPQKETA